MIIKIYFNLLPKCKIFIRKLHSSIKGVSYTHRTDTCGNLSREDEFRKVCVAGWLQYQRLDGKFLLIRDYYGLVQVLLQQDEMIQLAKKIPLESVIEVKGIVALRPENQVNLKMSTGEIEILSTELKILNSCRSILPFQIGEFSKVKEPLRLQYRYLDLRNSLIQNNLRLRSQVIFKMKEYLTQMNGFVDVETPTLFTRTPGGAREFLVPTHFPNHYYTLPQSPQQFKQLLMVGGIDRYMQIARCYRDETMKPDRQPEFTQLDIEMSFIDMEGIEALIEDLISYSWPDNLPYPTFPFQKMSYKDAIEKFGSDKPDLRFDMQLQNVTQVFEGNRNFISEIYLNGKSGTSVQFVRFPNIKDLLTNKDIDKLLLEVKKQFIKDQMLISITRINSDGTWTGGFKKHFSKDFVDDFIESYCLKPGDTFILTAGPHINTCIAAGKLRVGIADLLSSKDFEIREKSFKFLWIEDFPLFSRNEDHPEKFESVHHPFTAPHPSITENDLKDITRLDNILGQHYDLVLNGAEIGGGSIRIHDSQLQRYVLENILKENCETLNHLLEALSCGCPPHGGIALGLDRYIALLCNSESIRDVIAFPKTNNGKCLMSKAPSTVTIEDTKYYHLKDPQTNL